MVPRGSIYRPVNSGYNATVNVNPPRRWNIRPKPQALANYKWSQRKVAKKLFVGNLPYTTTNEDLAAFFARYGEVLSAAVIMDRATGRSKGFGFVEMTNDPEADAAIAQSDSAEFEGRKLTVSEARPKTEGPRPEIS